MSTIDFPLIDFDSHYYEVLDAWTRHLDPKLKKQHRGVEIVTSGNRTYPMVGGKLSNFIPNITFDPVAAPGSHEAYFRGEAEGKSVKELARVESPRPEYQHREPRRRLLDHRLVHRREASELFGAADEGCGRRAGRPVERHDAVRLHRLGAALEREGAEQLERDVKELERTLSSTKRQVARAETAARHAQSAVDAAAEKVAEATAALQQAQQRAADMANERDELSRLAEETAADLEDARRLLDSPGG